VSYNSSKSAVLQMARSMACELGTENIRVNSLSPGHIYTSVVVMMIRALWVQDDSCLSRHPTTSLG
jgi:NAD(P)-dependent dehydrogenase (short-subunit alcohol dehydrogenase family)